jgi:zinc transport system permease protein
VSFWDAYDFWRDSMAGVLLAGALCAFLGVYVLLRRVVFVGAALTQLSGVGVALAFWVGSLLAQPGADPHDLAHGLLDPRVMSLAAAMVGSLLFSLNRGGRRLASETIVGLGWVVASAALLLLLSSKRIVQETHEVEDLLYGNAVLVNLHQVKVLAGVAGALLVVHVLFFKELLFITHDAEMARTVGYRTRAWDMLLYATFGIGISFAVQTIGALPAFGFLVIPSAGALLLVDRAVWAFPLAVLFAVLGGGLGYYLAFTLELPTGAAIVASSALFLLPGLVRRVLVRR